MIYADKIRTLLMVCFIQGLFQGILHIDIIGSIVANYECLSIDMIIPAVCPFPENLGYC